MPLKGEDGAKRIKDIMRNMRENLPENIGVFKVCEVRDYAEGADGLPKSDVLKFFLDGGWFAARPSGTEPKIKFYYEIDTSVDENAEKSVIGFADSLA